MTRVLAKEFAPGSDGVAAEARAELKEICHSDALWRHMREEASAALELDPTLTPLIVGSLLNCESFAEAMVRRVSARLDAPALSAQIIADAFRLAVADEPSIVEAFRADLTAVVERDPACGRLIDPFLYFKGFHAIEGHRLAHWLWRRGRIDFALYLQSRGSEVFQTDIHPAARFGRGIFLDHATGLVVGETAVVEDDVSILQNVTLGGSGKETGDRHPKVRRGVLIGAGAKILGNIEIGACTRVAAGSVVLKSTPRNVTVAGVPAKVVGPAGCAEPARDMDQLLSELAYDAFSYVI